MDKTMCTNDVCEKRPSDLERLRIDANSSIEKLRNVRIRFAKLVESMITAERPETCSEDKDFPIAENKLQEISNIFLETRVESDIIDNYIDKLEGMIQ